MRYLFTLILFFSVMSYCPGEEITCKSTAYCLTSRTNSEAYAFPGVIAADYSVIPYGSIVYVEGYGYAVVLDCGKAIKGKRIDVWFPEYKTCKIWGIKTVKVKILRKGLE